ncbi:MAG: hypothetical protein H0V14_08875 [Chitinophagaceae bacterium]|nr:hypothetical protein [Chitinophagaceae bacterium]
MQPNQNNDLVPGQLKGAQSNTEHSVTAKSRDEALDIFKRAYKRLLNINIWQKLSGKATADFELRDSDGEEEHRLASVNDYFKIDIPGPGSAAGEGYDWVKVEEIADKTNPEADEESFSMRVRPSIDPNNESTDVAHFFTDESTSTFVISRKGNTITASVFGRNEKPNTDTKKVVDKIRNAAIGSTAIAGISKIQWASLVKGLLTDEVAG